MAKSAFKLKIVQSVKSRIPLFVLSLILLNEVKSYFPVKYEVSTLIGVETGIKVIRSEESCIVIIVLLHKFIAFVSGKLHQLKFHCDYTWSACNHMNRPLAVIGPQFSH